MFLVDPVRYSRCLAATKVGRMVQIFALVYSIHNQTVLVRKNRHTHKKQVLIRISREIWKKRSKEPI